MKNLVLAVAMVVASAAWADVGKVVLLGGAAKRAPKDGAGVALEVGSSIELGDTLTVDKGNLKIELTDGSVIMLSEKSTLVINEAEFEGQERRGFGALLKAGSLWTKVKKAIGGARYEVATERAVAGVRGTIFRIDADALVKAAKGSSKKARTASIVRVTEGVVNVKPSAAVAAASKSAVPKAVAAKPGTRVQVAGPTEISADEWEKRFVDLQQNQQVAVGVDLWEQAEIDAATRNDAFSKWIEKNQ